MHGLDPLPGGIRRRRSIIDLAGGSYIPSSAQEWWSMPRTMVPCGSSSRAPIREQRAAGVRGGAPPRRPANGVDHRQSQLFARRQVYRHTVQSELLNFPLTPSPLAALGAGSLPKGGCRKSHFEPQRTQRTRRKEAADSLRSLWFKLHRLAADATVFAAPSKGEGVKCVDCAVWQYTYRVLHRYPTFRYFRLIGRRVTYHPVPQYPWHHCVPFAAV